MHTDLDLIYWLSAHGEALYGLALARTEKKEHAEQILQKIFVDLVNFPPRLEGEALTAALSKNIMKQTRGSKILSADPVPLPKELEEELLALMVEAREHEGILPPPAKKWRKEHTIWAACLGFLLILCLSFTLLFGGGEKTITEEIGSGDLLKPIPNQQATPPQEPQPPQPLPDEKEELYPFNIIESYACKTYTELPSFVAAIEARNTPGYGSEYYNARELLLLPTRLPDGAKFRYLYLNPQTGNYSYSFQFEEKKVLYLLDFEVSQVLPSSALSMEEALQGIRNEKVTRSIKGASLSCTFGNDRVSVTLSAPKSKKAPSSALCKKFLDVTIIERCSLDNPFLQAEH